MTAKDKILAMMKAAADHSPDASQALVGELMTGVVYMMGQRLDMPPEHFPAMIKLGNRMLTCLNSAMIAMKQGDPEPDAVLAVFLTGIESDEDAEAAAGALTGGLTFLANRLRGPVPSEDEDAVHDLGIQQWENLQAGVRAIVEATRYRGN